MLELRPGRNQAAMETEMPYILKGAKSLVDKPLVGNGDCDADGRYKTHITTLQHSR